MSDGSILTMAALNSSKSVFEAAHGGHDPHDPDITHGPAIPRKFVHLLHGHELALGTLQKVAAKSRVTVTSGSVILMSPMVKVISSKTTMVMGVKMTLQTKSKMQTTKLAGNNLHCTASTGTANVFHTAPTSAFFKMVGLDSTLSNSSKIVVTSGTSTGNSCGLPWVAGGVDSVAFRPPSPNQSQKKFLILVVRFGHPENNHLIQAPIQSKKTVMGNGGELHSVTGMVNDIKAAIS